MNYDDTDVDLSITREDLGKKTARELYKISKAIKVKNYTHFRKPDLLVEIEKRMNEIKGEKGIGGGTPGGRIAVDKDEAKGAVKVQMSQENRTKERPLGSAQQCKTGEKEKEEMFVKGLLEIHPDGYGFLRANYFPSFSDVYVSPPLIRRFGLRTGDTVSGPVQGPQRDGSKYSSLVVVKTINGVKVTGYLKRPVFETLTPMYPDQRIILETPGCNIALRIMDLVDPLGKGQRGLIVSPPKAGKTTLIKAIAQSVTKNHPEITLMVLLIDERPEEVTDMQMSVSAEVISSTFDQSPENHIRVVELALERAKRLVEMGQDVMILLDGITRLTRAYNLLSSNTGKTLSGGLDPSAIKGPKKFLGAARNILNGGSLTMLATALIDTGSRLDQVIYEEFKGTGNMEIILNRSLAEQMLFPAVDIKRSGTRKEELLYTPEEYKKIWTLRKFISSFDPSESLSRLLDMLKKTESNKEFLESIMTGDEK
jgi:transcription termination factor Rho